MRILIANDGVSDVGGVQTYLDAVVAELRRRGHELAVAYCTDSGAPNPQSALQRLPRHRVSGDTAHGAWHAIRRWGPDVCFSHNMAALGVDRQLADVAPVVKFMHGYFGTCISAMKTRAFPSVQACDRSFGPACAALYLPRRCGRMSPVVLLNQLRWTHAQRAQFGGYAALVVASEHMGREYANAGVEASTVHVNPLFPSLSVDASASPAPETPSVAFLARMTRVKGGDVLIGAVREAMDRLGRPIALVMIGDGPLRDEWESMAARLEVPARFAGWLTGSARWQVLRGCSLVALPSVWPEPFGLVGLEGGALGVPAIATDVGGVRQWLREGVNGVLVPAPASAKDFGHALAHTLGDHTRLTALREGALAVAREMSLTSHVDRLEPVLARAAACVSRALVC